MVAEIHVKNVTPTQMLARLLRIEYLLGRTDKGLKKPRTSRPRHLILWRPTWKRIPDAPASAMHLRQICPHTDGEIAPQFRPPALHKEIADRFRRMRRQRAGKTLASAWPCRGARLANG